MRIIAAYKLPEKGFESLLKAGHEIVFPQSGYFSEQELLDLMPTADVLISVFTCAVTEEMIGKASKLKLIANYGVGYNTIDVDAATKHGIVVTNTPDPVIEPTAELAMTLMMALSRRVTVLNRDIRIKEGLRWGIMENLGSSLFGKTLGIVGMGNIGQALARRALANGMKIIYNNRNRVSETIEKSLKASYVSLDTILCTSDYISLNAPYTKETHHIINKEALAKMKASAYLINTARGPLIDEAALAGVLKEGRIAGAGLDVFENEPLINEQLLALDNVIMMPHVGTGTIDARIAIGECVSDNILRFLAGEKDLDIVNPLVWKHKDEFKNRIK